MKQRWKCETCGKSNFVEFDPGELIPETQNSMIENHGTISPECESSDLKAPVFFNADIINNMEL